MLALERQNRGALSSLTGCNERKRKADESFVPLYRDEKIENEAYIRTTITTSSTTNH